MKTYYLWKKKGNDKSPIFFITDYKEISKKGFVRIDKFGDRNDLELIFSSSSKQDCHNHALNYKK